jgi:hypothetical protein
VLLDGGVHSGGSGRRRRRGHTALVLLSLDLTGGQQVRRIVVAMEMEVVVVGLAAAEAHDHGRRLCR